MQNSFQNILMNEQTLLALMALWPLCCSSVSFQGLHYTTAPPCGEENHRFAIRRKKNDVC